MQNRVMALGKGTIESLIGYEDGKIKTIGNYIYIPSEKLESSINAESSTSLNDFIQGVKFALNTDKDVIVTERTNVINRFNLSNQDNIAFI